MICYLKNKTCESYYVRGRHSSVDSFYLAQNYFKLPRQTIRENTKFICLFPQDLTNLNYIFDDHVGRDMTKEECRQLCKMAWEKQYGFVIIYLSSKQNNGKYRSGLDEFYIPKMEDLLKQIVNNTEPKRSFSIILVCS